MSRLHSTVSSLKGDDGLADRRVTFPDIEGAEGAGGSTSGEDTDDWDRILENIGSDVTDIPRQTRLQDVCFEKNDEPFGGGMLNPGDYDQQRDLENQEFEGNSLGTMELLAPFKLEWVYGRAPDINVINLTGLFKNHIAYVASNVLVIYDYVANEQQCLQGHKNTITGLACDGHNRFFATCDTGNKSLIIIWDVLKGKALKYFPDPHDGTGCVTVAFTGADHILASVGSEPAGKQTICLWDFGPSSLGKSPIVVGQLPATADIIRELCFDDSRPEFFIATGDKNVIFCTWQRVSATPQPPDPQNDQESSDKDSTASDTISCHEPRRRKKFMSKYKKFCNSIWMKEGQWAVTSTMAGYLCVWTPPMVLGLENIPDPNKNIREINRYFKLSEYGLTFFTIHAAYVVVGDENGIIRFFDHDLKLLRWTQNFQMPRIECIAFNMNDELASFKKHLRQKFDKQAKNYLHLENNSKVRDYSLGGTKDRQLSMINLERYPLPCTDFIFSASSGNVYYYHFNQMKTDLLVPGSPGKFVTCDICPGSNHVVFATRKGDIHMYDFTTHKLIFSDHIFTGNHLVSTMKFHPTGYFASFGLIDGRMCFRKNFSWKTFIPPLSITASPVLRIVFSSDGLLLSYFTNNKMVVLLKYLPKVKAWSVVGKSKIHQLDICDVQFLFNSKTRKNRLFSLGLDRYLIEYDTENCPPGAHCGLRVLKVMKLEETCQPTAMVFNGPPEFGEDCITFSNTLNKLRLFEYSQERVRATVSGPNFGRDNAINRMITFPANMSGNRSKRFIVFVRGNKLGIIDTPVDGNPNKYMAVFTHPGPIIDISVTPEKERIFTVGHQDNTALQWHASMRSVEATVIMGGSGVAPFLQNVRRNWGEAGQDIIKDIELIIFYLNLKRIEIQSDVFSITPTIRIAEIPTVCRTCGFYPSEYEIDLMIDEARRIKTVRDQQYADDETTEFAFEDFIKLFSNHCYRITESEIEDAYRYLGCARTSDLTKLAEPEEATAPNHEQLSTRSNLTLEEETMSTTTSMHLEPPH